MSGPFGSSQWMYNAGGGFYDFEISNSLRFDTASSTYLNRNSYTHDRQTFTYSFWFKPTNPSVRQFIFGRYINGANVSVLEYDAGGQLAWYDYQGSAYTFRQRTTALFRDVSAWYHVVLRVDTTDSTAGSRARMYVNGTQQTSFTASTTVNQNVSFLLGDGGNSFRWGTEGSNNRFMYGGYLADIIVIDGSSLPPTSFAETKNDIWIPKSDIPGSDSYGARGYRLEFKNNVFDNGGSSIGVNTGSNSTDLGAPIFTASGFAAGDSVPDSPTNNFATLNPIAPDTTGATNHSFSEGSLKVSTGSDSWWNAFGTIGISSGKYYWEYYALGSGSVDQNIGVCTFDWNRGSNAGADSADAYTLYAQSAGVGYSNTDGTSSNLGSGYFWTWGNIMSVAFDADTGKIWYAKNGTFLGSGDPAAGSNEVHTVTSGDLAKGMLPVFSGYHTGGTPVVNFGQDSSFVGNETAQGNADENGKGDFYYAPPSGFLALCTANLPDPVATIDPNKGGSPQDYFNTNIFTGNGTNQDIDAGFNPDLIWTRQRTDASGGLWMDRLRGTDAYLQTTNLNAEGDLGDITFATNGYTVTGNSNLDNEASHNYVGWSWKAGGDGSSNTDGTINTTKTSVAAHGGFSISTYTGTGSNATVGHGLSSAPTYVMVKERNGGSSWVVGTPPFSGRILFESNEAIAGNGTGQWQQTAPSSTVVTIGTHASVNRNSSAIYVMYCFADVDGMQKSGKYTGNGNADGPFVYTGFRPAWLMIKRTDSARSWVIVDNVRDPDNEVLQTLEANATDAEYTNDNVLDFLSNGFKTRSTGPSWNTDGGNYIYLAFAEQPFKYANAR